MPAIISLLVTPLILYVIYPPETKDTPDAPALAAKRLESMGAVTKNEWIMIGTMLFAVSLWVFGLVFCVDIIILTSLLRVTWLFYLLWFLDTNQRESGLMNPL